MQQQQQRKSVPNVQGIQGIQGIPQSNYGQGTGVQGQGIQGQGIQGQGIQGQGTPNQFLLAAQTITKVQENTHHWSDLLTQQNKPIPKDVLFYQQLINRDLINKEMLNNESSFERKKKISKLIKNLNYYNDLKISRMKTINLSNQNNYTNTIWGEGYQGYGNDFTNGPTRLILPNNRKKPSRLNIFKEKSVNSNTNDILVPIRLDFEIEKDKFKLRDFFIWNLNESSLTLENLVSLIMEDYKLNNPLLFDTILSSIKDQINDFNCFNNFNFKKNDYDLRILIKLDIIIGNIHLIDQFEWDISNKLNNPEEFSELMCQELSLPGEFSTAISFSIREQSQLFIKSLYLIDYDFNNGIIIDEEIKQNLLSSINLISNSNNYLRSFQILKNFTPNLIEISNNELEKFDKDRERDSRRKRRQGRTNRRGGPILPDLNDLPRTFRTPVPSSILPGAIDFDENVSSYNIITETINKPIIDSDNNLNDINNNNIHVNNTNLINEHESKGKVIINHNIGQSCLVSIKLK